MTKDFIKRVLFIINPSSGNYPRGGYRSDICNAAEKYEFRWMIYETTGQNDSEAIGSFINEFNPDTVVCIGGDGTVNMVARELKGTNIKLGIIPAGSANGLAYNLSIPDEFNPAIDKIFNSHAGPVDMISINDKYYCLHLCDIGINARIVKRFEKEGSKGMIGYGIQLFKELFGGKTCFSFFIGTQGMPRRKYKSEMLVIANAKCFGSGAAINPIGKYNDGLFELVVIRPYPWWFVFVLLFASFTGQLHRMKYIKVFSVPRASITLTESQELQVDGEIVPEITSLTLKIMPAALKVLGA